MKKLLNPAISLFFICFFTTMLLAFVYQMTAPTIAARSVADQVALQQEVMPAAETFTLIEGAAAKDPTAQLVEAYKAETGGKTTGYVLILDSKGYGGTIKVMVGVTSEELSITGLRLISNTETPGLGANAANPAFTDKFAEKTGTPALTVVKAGMGSGAENEIDAIASATITSTAVTKAAQAGLDVAAQLTKEGEN